MKEKYIDEQVGCWFIFGEYPDNTVDINNSIGTVLSQIPKGIAEEIVEAQHQFREKLYHLLSKEPK
jgi:hypothetical protein